MRLNRVVLPAPLGPMRPVIWPCSMLQLTRCSASSPPKRLVTSKTSSRCIGVALCQRCQQRLRLLEVGGVKALGETAVDLCQELVRRGPLALLLPQARQAHGGAQLIGFRALAPGDVEGLAEAGLGLGERRGYLLQHEFTPQ